MGSGLLLGCVSAPASGGDFRRWTDLGMLKNIPLRRHLERYSPDGFLETHVGCVSPGTIDKGLASAASFQCHGCSFLTISGEESAAACARNRGRPGCELNSQQGQNFHWAVAELGSEIRVFFQPQPRLRALPEEL